MDLTWNIQYVPGGNHTNPTSSMAYAYVVSLESAGIDFLVAALNGLDILVGEIHNVYLNVKTK